MANCSRDAVLFAISNANLEALAQIIATDGAAAVRLDGDPQELTALHMAAAAGQLESVYYLLSSAVGADPCAARINNFTPLHAAAMNGHADICKVLLRAGAAVNVQTAPQGYAPLHSAAFAGHLDAIKTLLAHGGNRELVNYRGERPADTAKRQGQSTAAQLLETASL